MDNSKKEYVICELTVDDFEEASSLAISVFNKYEAPDYSDEGINTFHDFCTPQSLEKIMQGRNLKLWGAYINDRLIGLIATRDGNHIALFFVDGEYHRRGIGHDLFNTALKEIADAGYGEVTVNSSPYAAPVYRSLGFTQTDVELLRNGIRFTPMLRKV